MRFSSIRIVFLLALAAVMLPAIASAQDPVEAQGTEPVEETIEVKRAETKGPKHPSLRFLRDHRVFLRARLDLLSTQITRVRTDKAEILDERYLRLKEMAEAIAAARDTVHSEYELTPGRELLTSVTELADLEAELTLMETLLAEQRERLLWLEEDFLGRQETALVILVKGLAGKNAPTSIVLTEESNVVRVGLAPEQRTSLEQGGIAQIYHEFVEPRELVFSVSFTGKTWTESEPVEVTVEPVRDRLTFLELDLSQLNANREALGLLTSIWYR